MHIYIPKKKSAFFLDKLKEISIIDDYILDSSRFGREKIKVESKWNTPEHIDQLLPYLPKDTVIVDKTDYPGPAFFLLVGEVHITEFDRLKEEQIQLTILTKKDESVRINGWVPFSQLETVYQLDYLTDVTSMNGQIKDSTYFAFTSTPESLPTLVRHISTHSNDYIIKDRTVYVKLLLQDFSTLYATSGFHAEKIDILDEGEFI